MHDTSYRQYAQWRIKMYIAQSLLYPSEVISELITQCVCEGGETYANCCNTKNKVIRTIQRYRCNSSEEIV